MIRDGKSRKVIESRKEEREGRSKREGRGAREREVKEERDEKPIHTYYRSTATVDGEIKAIRDLWTECFHTNK